ncbi:hypothetical protein CASFOL_004027 [Castilleja foliolosa]|uniref:Uncharacterized protein n=1 Tax=Castilleja foliolosa TaxID=1961234 RepID=A0ABD3EJI4_9LAMI
MSTDECSSNESGWTTYIASPYNKYNDDEDEDDYSVYEQKVKQKDYRNVDDSDDSMASDASSGPSDHRHRQFIKQKEKKNNERKNAGKKQHQQQQEKIKAAKDRADSVGRSKKSKRHDISLSSISSDRFRISIDAEMEFIINVSKTNPSLITRSYTGWPFHNLSKDAKLNLSAVNAQAYGGNEQLRRTATAKPRRGTTVVAPSRRKRCHRRSSNKCQ